MSIWRVILAVVVAVLTGFVGGVWFVGTGLAFRWVKPPQVSAASNRSPQTSARQVDPRRPSLLPAKREVLPIGVPDPTINSGSAGGLGLLAERSDLSPTPGCRWEVEPYEFQVNREWHKSDPERLLVSVPTLSPESGQYRVWLTQTSRTKATALALRYVLFDAAGNRFPAKVSTSGSSGGSGGHVEFTHHEWADLGSDNVGAMAYFGVERVTPESDQLSAASARAEAKQKDVPLLPPPRLGEPFEFDLPTIAGTRVRSADLKGKAVLVVIAGPFPQNPTAMSQIRKEFSAADLAVVGISFDATAEAATKTFEHLGKTAGIALVPNDPVSRRLWREGSEIASIPAYWIVDPAGVLRFEGHWFGLTDQLAIVLGRPTRRGKFDAFVKENRAKRASPLQTQPPPKSSGSPPAPPTTPPARPGPG